jgi:hypothetical protein
MSANQWHLPMASICRRSEWLILPTFGAKHTSWRLAESISENRQRKEMKRGGVAAAAAWRQLMAGMSLMAYNLRQHRKREERSAEDESEEKRIRRAIVASNIGEMTAQWRKISAAASGEAAKIEMAAAAAAWRGVAKRRQPGGVA